VTLEISPRVLLGLDFFIKITRLHLVKEESSFDKNKKDEK